MILVSVNQAGALTSATQTVRQGNTVQMFVSAPYNQGTCRLLLFKPTALTPIYEDVAVNLTNIDGQKVYGFNIPTSATAKAGTVFYQFCFTATQNDVSNVFFTDKGSFTVNAMNSFSIPASVQDLSAYTIAQLYTLINNLYTKLSFYDETTGKINISGDLKANGTATFGHLVSDIAYLGRIATENIDIDAPQVIIGGITYQLIGMYKVGSSYRVVATKTDNGKEILLVGIGDATRIEEVETLPESPVAGKFYHLLSDDKYYIYTNEWLPSQKILAYCPTTWQILGGKDLVWGEIGGSIINQTDLQTALNAKMDATDVSALIADVNAIKGKIPNEATSSNKLADKAFVNSTVATNTANYISNNGVPFTSLAQLQAYTGTVTNNDYAFVQGTDEYGNNVYDRYKATVSEGTVTWALEYRLNNSSFTSAQWNALNSGITAEKVATYDAQYTKPVSGIPQEDMAVGVQTSLNRASALTDAYINNLIDAKVQVIEDGNY